jgi:hypothetical protein
MDGLELKGKRTPILVCGMISANDQSARGSERLTPSSANRVDKRCLRA